MKRILLAGAAFAVLGACATAPVEDAEEVIIAEETAAEETDAGSAEVIIVEKTDFDLAMESVDQLVAGQNEQAAIDRLTQLLGNPALSDEEIQIALLKRGTIRMSDRGYDTWEAIADFEEIIAKFGPDALDGVAQEKLDEARGKATSLNFKTQQPGVSRVEKFQAMFDLGDHEEAVDLMLATNLNPGNDYLVAMYQIGWLCEGEGFTGPVYPATEPDGTNRSLQFCDFGK